MFLACASLRERAERLLDGDGRATFGGDVADKLTPDHAVQADRQVPISGVWA